MDGTASPTPVDGTASPSPGAKDACVGLNFIPVLFGLLK